MENININIDIITKIIALVSTIVSTLIIFIKLFKNTIDYSYNEKRKKLLTLKELNETFDRFGDNFRDSFIKDDLKELYFSLRTGIETNAVSIEKYIELKNKLGKNFTWKTIKNSKSYLVFKDNHIIVKISCLEQILTYIFLTIVFISFIVAIGMIILFYNSFADFTRDIWIKFIGTELVILSSAMYLFCSINPALQAISIKKRLKELES